MKITFIRPLKKFLPEIKAPSRIPSMSERLIWVGIAVVIYFLMYNTTVIGVKPLGAGIAGDINFISAVTAANMGSLLTTGIGPIVLASIFLQLFMGAKIIDVDMSNPDDKKDFFTLQKTLAILLSVIEAIFFTIGTGFIVLQDATMFGGQIPLMILVAAQIALGSIILMYLDEIINKRGIGSGISLFIAAGVSFMVVSLSLSILGMSFDILAGGAGAGAETIPRAIEVLTPIFATGIVFLVVVYAEALKVEIPLVFGRLRGMDTVHAIPLLYVSNIPVILTAALLMNVQVVANVVPAVAPELTAEIQQSDSFIDRIIIVAQKNPLALFIYNIGGSERKVFVDGFFNLLTPSYIVPNRGTSIKAHIDTLITGRSQVLGIPLLIHLIVYVLAYMVLSTMFGLFWVETAGLTAKDVSKQLFQYGLHIPGMRRDPRIIEMTLQKYIPTITIIGSAFVGLLAALANITGALGTGTGILLTVMILHRLYQQLDQMGAFRFIPIMGKIIGR